MERIEHLQIAFAWNAVHAVNAMQAQGFDKDATGGLRCGLGRELRCGCGHGANGERVRMTFTRHEAV